MSPTVRFRIAPELLLLVLLVAWLAPAAAEVPLHHELTVRLLPDQGRLLVRDRLPLPLPDRFQLNAATLLSVQGGQVQALDDGGNGRLPLYQLRTDPAADHLLLEYQVEVGAMPAHSEHGMPLAVLDGQGAFLDGAAGWYPRFGSGPLSFELRVEGLPAGWEVVSQGERLTEAGRILWRAQAPQEEIYLLAGPFSLYRSAHRGIELQVFLLQPDAELAQRYLDAMGAYFDWYGGLIGAYPYPKFAVVENRWQTGYGMPSFTLLGSQVLRLPFILTSSLPHEILHNWWGNGVYIDPAAGNWGEGLTAYLADHLLRERDGAGAAYRRQALERYASFAAEGRDFPLADFRARHDEASQAVGYGKALMLFHMLRLELGDAGFIAGLRAFWQQWRFRAASFDDLRVSFAGVAGGMPRALAGQWLERPGAPSLALHIPAPPAEADGAYLLRLELSQQQQGEPYPLQVPLVLQFADGSQQTRMLPLPGRQASFALRLDTPPARMDVDPWFDLFRLLDPAERPSALGRLFGASRQLVVLPSAASAESQAAWRELAEGWQRRYGNVEVVTDGQLSDLPDDTAVWLLGWDNALLPEARQRLQGAGQALSAGEVVIEGGSYPRSGFVSVLLDPDNSRPPLGFVGADTPDAIRGLARKLPHYGGYGRLVFGAGDLQNRLKQKLPVQRSPLSALFGPLDPGPPQEPRRSLILSAGD